MNDERVAACVCVCNGSICSSYSSFAASLITSPTVLLTLACHIIHPHQTNLDKFIANAKLKTIHWFVARIFSYRYAIIHFNACTFG